MTIHSVFDIPGFLPLMNSLKGKRLQGIRKVDNAGISIQIGEHRLTITPGIHPDDGLPCKAIRHGVSTINEPSAGASDPFSILSASLCGEVLLDVVDEDADGIGLYFQSRRESLVDSLILTPKIDRNGQPYTEVALSFATQN